MPVQPRGAACCRMLMDCILNRKHSITHVCRQCMDIDRAGSSWWKLRLAAQPKHCTVTDCLFYRPAMQLHQAQEHVYDGFQQLYDSLPDTPLTLTLCWSDTTLWLLHGHRSLDLLSRERQLQMTQGILTSSHASYCGAAGQVHAEGLG